jgi:hypothetical protein
LVFPGSVQELEALKRRVMETGQATRQEVAAVAPGEKMEFYDLWVEPLLNNSGHIVSITCAAADISGRKRVEETLRILASEEEALIKEVHYRVKTTCR